MGLLLKGPLRESCFTAGAPDMANCGSSLSALIRRREVPGVWVVGGVGLATSPPDPHSALENPNH